MTALQPLQRRTQRQRSRYLDDSSTSVSMLQYGNDGAFLLSLQVALYNPAVEQEINLPSSGLVEELYAMYYTTILRNSIAFLFCTAVQDVLFVNSQNQNVCPTLIAAVRDNDVTTTSSMSGGGGDDDDDDDEDDALEDSVSIDSSNTNANVNATTAPTVTPTILDEVPYQIRVVPRNVTIGNTSDYAGDMFTFAIWYIDYTIVQIGSVYIEEAIIQTGNSDSSWNRTTSTTESVLDITDVSIEAVKAMNVVLQLTLDVNTMDTSTGGGGSDGDTNNSNNEDNENNSLFDTILQTISNSSLTSTNTTTITGDATNTMNNNRYDRRLRSYLCSSPVVEDDVVNADPSNNIMIQKFTTLYEQYQSTYDDPYRPSTTFITPMRLGGIALFIATIAVYTVLLHVSASRRKRRTMKLAARQQPHRKLVPQQSQQQQQQQRTAIHQNAAMSSSTKPMSNRVLAVPPSVPSSPMVRLARTDAR